MLSILLPVYNCEPYLDRCIPSLLRQTWSDFEVLVSDDGSADRSLEMCRRYAATDHRIKIFAQPKNLGSIANMNFLLQIAEGDWLTIHGADDWSEPDRFEKQMQAFKEYSGLVLSGCNGMYHYPSGAVRVERSPTRLYQGITINFPSTPASAIFRRDALAKTGLLHSFFKGGSSTDRYFLMEILEGEPAIHLAEPLYHATISPGSEHRGFDEWKLLTHFLFLELESQRRASGTDWLKENKLPEIEAFLEKTRGNRRLMGEKYREYASYQLDTNNVKLARTLLAKAFALNPVNLRNFRTLKYYLQQRLFQ